VPKVNRRLFVVGGLAAGGALAVPTLAGAAPATVRAAAPRPPSVPDRPTGPDPFGMGVASGEPRPDGMVLWTRLATRPLEIGGGMGDRPVPVDWQVATDERFADVVASGTETTGPADGHSVHAEPRGLPAGAELFYRFRVNGHISPIGRTRTTPAPGAAPGSMTFATASCQHLEEGWYHAHHFIAADEPDLVLFLGDYMYETRSGADDVVRRYVETDIVDDLDGYRLRYAQTALDPGLQAARAVAPWLVVFDDHELRDNWWGAGPGWSAARKRASFQAYWENMPLPRSLRPTGPAIPLYRRVRWGTLAGFHMLDTRQYRWRQARGGCAEVERADRTLTGAAQERWLLDGLAGRRARWDLLGQQAFFAGRDGDGRDWTCDVNKDAWDGYPASRRRIVQGWLDRRVRNPVVLTGDVHRHWANDLRLTDADQDSPVVGTELVTTSVTSNSSGEVPPDLAYNPHLNYIGNSRGYLRARLTGTELTAEFMKVSSVLEPDPAKVTLSVARRFHVADGRPGLLPG